MKILIVDDHALFREGLGLLISQLESCAEISLVENVERAVEHIEQTDFDLILLDWNLDGLTGEEALKVVHGVNRSSRIVVLSAERDVNLIRRTIDLGASGFIHKDSSPASLISAIQSILEGEVYLPSDAFIHPIQPPQGIAQPVSRRIEEVFPHFTARQVSILSGLVRGLSNKSIGRELNISPHTVKHHLKDIYRVLNVNSRTQALYVLAQNKVSV